MPSEDPTEWKDFPNKVGWQWALVTPGMSAPLDATHAWALAEWEDETVEQTLLGFEDGIRDSAGVSNLIFPGWPIVHSVWGPVLPEGVALLVFKKV